MTRTLTTAVLVAALSSAPHGCEAGETASTQVRSDDEATIKKICLERIDRFNRLHEPPQPGDFTSDADFVNIYGMWRRGAAEIESGQGERMKTVLREAKITLLDLRIRFVRPDVAIVHQTHEMSGMLSPAGERIPPHRELSVRVLVKEHDKWLTTAFHNTIVRPVAPVKPTQ